MKRIVYVTQQYPVVTETFTIKEVAGLRERGFDIDVRALRPVRRTRDLDPIGPATTVRPRAVRPLAFARAAIVAPPVHPRRALAAVRGAALAADLDAGRDHVHVQFPLDASNAGLYAAASSGASFSFSGHTYHELDLMQTKLRRARFVTVGSDFERELLCRRYGDRWRDRIHVRRLGVPERAARRAFVPGTIVSVGTLTGKKGHAVLIRAVAELGPHVRLEILGEGPERAELERLVAQLSLDSRVSLPGSLPHEEALDRVSRAEVFALACRETEDGDHDCLPVALMDAMSLAVPCVSSDAFGIPELIDDGRSGLLAPAGDHVAVAERLELLLRDAGRRDEVGAGGQAAVRGRFDLERNLDGLAELFRAELG